MPALTFTRKTTTHDRATDTFTVTSSEIVGAAIKVRGDPERYKALQLIEAKSPTLLFSPRTYGDRILPGDTVTWGGTTYTARDCNHIEPDGVVIGTRVIIEK